MPRARCRTCQRPGEENCFTMYLAGSTRRLSELAAAEGDFKQAYRLSAEATELTVKAERENTGKRDTRPAPGVSRKKAISTNRRAEATQ